MFVLLEGVSKDEAFRIGQDIVDTITALNPKPVKLKFEKVSQEQQQEVRSTSCRRSQPLSNTRI